MRKALWFVAWGGLCVAGAATFGAGWTSWSVRLTGEEIQRHIDRFLPQEHRGIRLDRAKILLIGPSLRFDASLVSTQLARKMSGDVVATGAPSYDFERSDVFFKAASLDLRSLNLSNTPPIGAIGEAIAQIGARVVPGQASVEETARFLIERVGNFVVRRAPQQIVRALHGPEEG